ncbi:patatin-like phospholipase family protein [Winogradskyella aurantia]|uniref:Patatin n=1 Tax=Winogradskyella aurantia TaxID=1915063 RepID=A0A265UXY6_9FLAO|nr:patatin-like phospholipase family protein [Winogradskyella aurantia]OZV70082.1 patatin [Winogradskyella aurantia]
MKEIGLALGGGAVLGAAHVGVLRRLEEYNIEVQHIAGTSIGAFVGAFFAFGKSCDEISRIASQLKWVDISAISLTRYGLLSNEKLGELIIEHIGEKNIEDSDIPLAIIATDITSGKKIVLDKGPLATAVMASTCIPGIFNPVEINGTMLVDGGIVENVPVKTMKEKGVDFIIGVDLNSNHKYQKPDNILDVIMNSFHFLIQKSDKLQSKEADLLIEPDLSEFNRSDTNHVDALIKKGYEDSKQPLEQLKKP